MEKKRLSESAENVYSQNGEDGIIKKIFGIIGTTSRVCIEFGAWDGIHLSNTANLWKAGWKGILIEGVADRFKRLKDNVKGYDCVCINAFVACAGERSLDSIITRAGIDRGVDLLSIDIDGDDIYIFESLNFVRPRVIICEYNPTIPAEIDLVAEYGSCFGASVSAINRIANKKSYTLVAITDTNCFFIKNELVPLFDEYEISLDKIKISKYISYLVSGFDGDYVVCGNPVFGLGIPYGGKLFGPHRRLPNTGLVRAYRALRGVYRALMGVYRDA